MTINFFIKYGTQYGDNIFVGVEIDKQVKRFALGYVDENLWHGSFDVEVINLPISYKIILSKDNDSSYYNLLATGEIMNYEVKEINIIHEDFPYTKIINLTAFKPYQEVFNTKYPEKISTKDSKKATHIFQISHGLLQDNTVICLTGNADCMNNFDNTNPLLFTQQQNNVSSLPIDLSKEKMPVEFKIGIYDVEKKKIVAYEPGDNRKIETITKNDEISIVHLHNPFSNYNWKAAGINVPVFSLRTNNSWGVGDFTDLNLLIDYAENVGFKLIQLLPINDTTAIYTDKDSYPYSAISSFAFHPKLLDVNTLAKKYAVDILPNEQQKINELNQLHYSDHSNVLSLKITILQRIFEADKNNFLVEKDWLSFFIIHQNWLTPFAAFCTLRDNYKTVDFSLWEKYSLYNDESIKALTSPASKHYSNILFWYFVQYQLHLQITKAVEYAHSKGIILKADLPIGVGRQSADTWQYPNLFVMGMQAGAPPDAFSGSGQNWSFPTYNIAEMSKDNFAWFRKRMGHLQTYFDAVRIDHVLGFFRIWSIPINQVEGTMGRFVPALPLSEYNFYNAGLSPNEHRYCSPYITDYILVENFGNDAGLVKEIFFNGHHFKDEYNDQRKIENYFIENTENIKWQQGLYNLLANVLFFKVDDGYHCRINMNQTSSYKHLSSDEKYKLDNIYHHYFFEMQNELWRKEGELKLEMLRDSTDILLCAEDLGMVPDFTDEVLKNLDILSLQVQQMPKDSASAFSDTAKAKYESVVMPATHDMSTIRLWWEENRDTTQKYFNKILNEYGGAPFYCEPWIAKKIIEKHLQSPAMWAIFLVQDIMAMDDKIRLKNPLEERINQPINPNHVWNYRMHISLEELLMQTETNAALKKMVVENGR